jgi:hypothetical protein
VKTPFRGLALAFLLAIIVENKDNVKICIRAPSGFQYAFLSQRPRISIPMDHSTLAPETGAFD